MASDQPPFWDKRDPAVISAEGKAAAEKARAAGEAAPKKAWGVLLICLGLGLLIACATVAAWFTVSYLKSAPATTTTDPSLHPLAVAAAANARQSQPVATSEPPKPVYADLSRALATAEALSAMIDAEGVTPARQRAMASVLIRVADEAKGRFSPADAASFISLGVKSGLGSGTVEMVVGAARYVVSLPVPPPSPSQISATAATQSAATTAPPPTNIAAPTSAPTSTTTGSADPAPKPLRLEPGVVYSAYALPDGMPWPPRSMPSDLVALSTRTIPRIPDVHAKMVTRGGKIVPNYLIDDDQAIYPCRYYAIKFAGKIVAPVDGQLGIAVVANNPVYIEVEGQRIVSQTWASMPVRRELTKTDNVGNNTLTLLNPSLQKIENLASGKTEPLVKGRAYNIEISYMGELCEDINPKPNVYKWTEPAETLEKYTALFGGSRFEIRQSTPDGTVSPLEIYHEIRERVRREE